MGMLGHKIPGYIYEKSNIVRLILLTAFFALVFINIYISRSVRRTGIGFQSLSFLFFPV